MKILYLSYDGMTDQLGQSQVLPYLQGLSKCGHTIHLISFEKQEHFKLYQQLIKDLTDQSKISWYPLTYHKNPPILSTVKDILNLRSKAFELQNKFRFDIVHCRSYITPFVGAALKRKFGVKFIFDMRGFFADERVDGKIWNLKNPIYSCIYRYFKKKEKEFLFAADQIISLTHSAEEILQLLNLKSQRLPITVIPCCVDLNLFNYNTLDLTKTIEVKKKLNIEKDAFVLTYLGAIGTWYMLGEMLDFFKQLLLAKPNAIFLFITNEHASIIENTAIEKNIPLSCLRFIAAQRLAVPQLLAVSDLSIFFIKPTFSKKASSPTKQGEIMGMGIPLICNAGIGDTDYIVNTSECGFVINKLDAENYKNAIEKIDELQNIAKEKIRNGAEKFFSLQKGVVLYNTVYNTLKKI